MPDQHPPGVVFPSLTVAGLSLALQRLPYQKTNRIAVGCSQAVSLACFLGINARCILAFGCDVVCCSNPLYFCANGLRIFTIICTFADVMNSQIANIHTLKYSEVQGKNIFCATFSAFYLVVCDILLHTGASPIVNRFYINTYARVRRGVTMIYKEMRKRFFAHSFALWQREK